MNSEQSLSASSGKSAPTRSAPVCAVCRLPIKDGERVEPYSYPIDARRVHSACAAELIGQLLKLLELDIPTPEYVYHRLPKIGGRS